MTSAEETGTPAAANQVRRADRLRQSPIAAFSAGAAVGLLGGMIGLGGAEFRLPLLIGLFGFLALQTVIVNKAITLIVVASALAWVLHVQGRRGQDQNLLLTISGDSDSGFGQRDASVISAVEEIAGSCSLQRFDLADGRGQVRLMLRRSDPRRTTELITRLRERLPECEFSYVNLNSPL